MIVGNLKHADRIAGLHPLFKTLFEYVASHDFDALPKGKVEVLGDDLFIMNNELQGVAQASQPLEMHRKYIDVHILLEGTERIGWKNIDDIAHLTKEYDADCDCALSDDAATTWVDLLPGEFCIVYPEDPHAPAIADGRIRKLIGKVKL
jgi:YhcH/YjgK/YiaL family protein